MKQNRILRSLTVAILSVSLSLGSSGTAFSGAVIKKPAKKSRNAAEYYTGTNYYYSANNQSWKRMKGSLLYTYKGKLDTRYYRPLYYLTGSWLSNNRQNLTVHLGQTRSRSVSSVVQSTLGISAPNVSLATSISRNYSSTISSSYSTDYTFVMKNYSRNYYYRPAFFGYILKYGVIKSSRFRKWAKAMYSYTFDSHAGLYLKLACR